MSITLIASDGTQVPISKTALSLSEMLQDSFLNDPNTTELKLQHIDGTTLKKVCSYLTYHEKVPARTIDAPLASVHLKDLVDAQDAQYAECDQELMFKVMVAASYLNIKPLLSLMGAKCATLIKGHSIQAAETFAQSDCQFCRQNARTDQSNVWSPE